MLHLSRSAYAAMIAHAYDCLPEEACGLMAGTWGGTDAPRYYPLRNAAASARYYEPDSVELMRAAREAEDAGHDFAGMMHTHTHTDAYPSPTDVEKAADPGLHYVIVSLKYEAPVLRSYRIADGRITEEPVVLTDG
jgi:proteasome lid subunit RPN8/RPN11